MKVCNIVGARPQFIKYYPVSLALEEADIEDLLVHTGQHYDYMMSKVFFDELRIREPDWYLGAEIGDTTKRLAIIVEQAAIYLKENRPDVVIVYGDTDSTLGGALAAAKLGIPIAHVEAGVRSFNKAMQEETNRVLVDHMSTFLFCPSNRAFHNLEEERLCGSPFVSNTGDVMCDAFKMLYDTAIVTSDIVSNTINTLLDRLCLLTIHRAENTDSPDNLLRIVEFVNKYTTHTRVVFPVHPRLGKQVKTLGLGPNVTLLKPISYYDTLALLNHCDLVITDSGGLQKEAFWGGRRCVTLRDETEWPETVESGWNQLYRNYDGGRLLVPDRTVYGDGHAAGRIVDILKANL